MAMLISSVERSLPCKRSRKYYHHQQIHDVNQNIDDNVASTSYDLDCSQCSTTSSNQEDSTFSGASPTRALRGSTRDAFGKIYGKDEFKFEERLGEGFFGEVYKVRPIDPTNDLPKVLVMKIGKQITNGKKNARITAKKAAERESQLLSKLNHPNILTFRGMCVDRENEHWSLHLLVDFCDRGSLQQLIVSKKSVFPWIQRCLIALNITSAMSYVNSRGYMHRDLTAMNILLQSQPRQPFLKAVVADFGLSAKIPKSTDIPEQVGSEDYMSPEMLLERPYTEKSDVFSFGVIICQMIPRIDAEHVSLYRTKDFGIALNEFSKICPKQTPKEFIILASECCEYNSEKRPSFQKLYERIISQKDFGRWKKVLKATFC
jgi:serine/threonine protein kinase